MRFGRFLCGGVCGESLRRIGLCGLRGLFFCAFFGGAVGGAFRYAPEEHAECHQRIDEREFRGGKTEHDRQEYEGKESDEEIFRQEGDRPPFERERGGGEGEHEKEGKDAYARTALFIAADPVIVALTCR